MHLDLPQVKLAAVRALLEHSGDPKLAPLALLREPEMMGLLGGKVVSIDGVRPPTPYFHVEHPV